MPIPTAQLTSHDTAIILAALRLWQQETDITDRADSIHLDGHKPPTDEEIDSLCERLNDPIERGWPWCPACSSYHIPNNPTCREKSSV
jgi:hypothetical protein